MKAKIEEIQTIENWFKNLLNLSESDPLPEIGPGPYLIPVNDHIIEGPEYVLRVVVHPGNEFAIMGRMELAPMMHRQTKYEFFRMAGSIQPRFGPGYMEGAKAEVIQHCADEVVKRNLVAFSGGEEPGEPVLWNFVCIDPGSAKEFIND